MVVRWEPCAAGARILRLLGDFPCPAVPNTVAGLPVIEIGPYCFAEREVTGGKVWPEDDEALQNAHPLCGDFLEEVTLPDTVTTLHSAAFYNCRKLRRVTLGPNLNSLGSDLFTNCRELTTLAVHAAPNATTGLKKLVGAVNADVSVQFLGTPGAELFYPEYFETLDENAPAHIFNRSIEGEGYRLRQCFTAAGAVDYTAYDAAFSQLTVGEAPAGCCRMAMGRLQASFDLSEEAAEEYTFYLNRHADEAFSLALAARDVAALRLLVGLGLPTAGAARLCAAAGWSEGAALLLGRGHKKVKSYAF